MRRRIVIGLVGSGIFLAGLLAGLMATGALPAFASSATPRAHVNQSAGQAKGAYCQVYEQRLAKDLGVTTAKLEQANQDAAQATIDQMYADGKITASQKAALEQRLKTVATQPCAHLGELGAHGAHGAHGAKGAPGLGGMFGPMAQAAHTQLATAVAGKLGISVATLDADLTAGQTIAQIATAQHVAIADVNTAYLGAAKSALAQAVSGGALTQAQSDQAYTMVQKAVAAGHYPLLERRGQGMDAPGAPIDPNAPAA